MFGSSQNIRYRKPLKEANFMSVYIYVYIYKPELNKTEPSSYGLCETKNKLFDSCIPTTKCVTTPNYYDICYIDFQYLTCFFKFSDISN